jgi:tetraacyldisaccharide 4'-kinase
MRGYKSVGGVSDEQRMLERTLNLIDQPPIIIRANPDRFAGGTDVLREHPEVDLFVLDDGFQHRKLARDFDLVLVSATDPFGFEHVHPRGLLREPLCGLKRADAVLITRADGVDSAALAEIEWRVRQHHSSVPIYRANHVQTGLRSDHAAMAMDGLAGKRVFAFCGIASPTSFFRQIEGRVGRLASSRAYSDHHAYSDSDIAAIDQAAVSAQAELIVTTEKDWAKLGSLAAATQTSVPIWRIEMAVQFWEGDEAKLLGQIHF